MKEPTWYVGIITTINNFRVFFVFVRIVRKEWIVQLGSFKHVSDRILYFGLYVRAVRDEILIYGSQRGVPWFTYLNKIYDWFEERLEIQAIADDITSKYVPPHVNIFYCLGGITLTCFLVQVATGFAMTFIIVRPLRRLLLRFNI